MKKTLKIVCIVLVVLLLLALAVAGVAFLYVDSMLGK